MFYSLILLPNYQIICIFIILCFSSVVISLISVASNVQTFVFGVFLFSFCCAQHAFLKKAPPAVTQEAQAAQVAKPASLKHTQCPYTFP